ncbi:DUF6777 domain-containing protein [Streptomyces niveus]|uniref:DUF6777 domain-containing protein n=1 Tax=Streptomyces niveus TaxID=193462 RepID=UPI000AB0A764|nr:DUF6777 domain-containing protein [Streptomyces niveus]
MRRLPVRRRHAAFAVLSAGILITAGCGGDSDGKDTRAAEAAQAAASAKVTLQPLTAPGPHPFTTSTAAPVPDASPSRPPSPSGPATRSQTLRSVSGATAGLYGGTKSTPSCDVDAQVRLLTGDRAKAVAFARAAGIGAPSLPTFLRGLTPVVLRADVRVTNHGYRDGAPTAFQAVLQSGTAVLVDDHGLPRVRCAGGNPLRPAVTPRADVPHQGTPWSGYRPDRVVVVKRGTQAVSALMIVEAVDHTWLERASGTDGDRDKKPAVPPPYPPDTDIIDPSLEPPTPDDGGSDSPDPGRSDPAVPDPDASERDPAPTPDCRTPDGPAPDEQWSEPMSNPRDCPTPTDGPDGGVDPDYPAMPMSPERQGPGGQLDGDPGAPFDDGFVPAAPDADPAGPATFPG